MLYLQSLTTVMVYGMVVYNVALNMAGVKGGTFVRFIFKMIFKEKKVEQ